MIPTMEILHTNKGTRHSSASLVILFVLLFAQSCDLVSGNHASYRFLRSTTWESAQTRAKFLLTEFPDERRLQIFPLPPVTTAATVETPIPESSTTEEATLSTSTITTTTTTPTSTTESTTTNTEPSSTTTTEAAPRTTIVPRPTTSPPEEWIDTYRTWQSIAFYVMFGVLLMLCAAYNIFRARLERAYITEHTIFDEMVFRQDLQDTDQDLANMWKCDVCGFDNLVRDHNCLLCGSEQGFLITQRKSFALGTTEAKGEEERKDGEDGYVPRSSARSSAENEAEMLRLPDGPKRSIERTRSFAIRRLNQLNQRQLGARRRNEWVRVKDADGNLVWSRNPVGATKVLSMALVRQNQEGLEEGTFKKGKTQVDERRSDATRTASSRSGSDASSIYDRGQGSGEDAASYTPGAYSADGTNGMPDWNRLSNVSTASTRSVGLVSRFVQGEEGENRLSFIQAEGAPASRAGEAANTHWKSEDLEEIAALPFRRKHNWFVQQCATMEIPWEYGHMLIDIERENLLHKSCEQLLWATPHQLHQPLRVRFKGEPGVDAGGLEREWFTLMAEEIFAETTGLFQLTHVENRTYTINPCSSDCSEDHLMYYQAIGRFIGRALFQGHVIPAHLTIPIYKHICGAPISFSDLQFVDGELYESLKWMKHNEGVEALCLDFSVVLPYVGERKIVDLKPNGREIDVTDENKQEYIDLRLRWIMLRSISEQLQSLMKGIFDVVPQEMLSVFDYQELELLMCGVPEIDVDDWRQHTIINGDFSQELLDWFWDVVRGFSEEEKARLLQFATGSARVPIQGFKALTMNDGRVWLFNLQLISKEVSMFPRAHTCFNRIDIPNYDKKSELEQALTLVINMEVTGFTIE